MRCQGIVVFCFVLLALSAQGFGLTLPEAKFKLGERLFQAGRYAEAAPEFQGLLSEYPESPLVNSALYYLAQIQARSGKTELALAYYEKLSSRALSIAHKRQALYGMAECHYKLGDYRSAGREFLSFSLEHRDSPARPAALYYGTDALRRISMDGEAELLARTLLLEYPGTSYAAKLLTASATPVPPSAVKPVPVASSAVEPTARPVQPFVMPEETPSPRSGSIRDAASSGLNPTEEEKAQAGSRERNPKPALNTPVPQIQRTPEPMAIVQPTNAVSVTTTNWMTNWIDVYQTNSAMVYSTNEIQTTNRFYLPGETPEPDAAEIERAREAARREQESIARYQAMVELKARLLEIKDRTLKEKEKILLESRE